MAAPDVETRKLPRVIIHSAISVDGRVDGFTADIELYYQLVSRWQEDATLVGSGTILAARGSTPADSGGRRDYHPPVRGDRRPLLVICDSRGRVKTWHDWRNQPYWREAIALCAGQTPPDHAAYLDSMHVRRIVTGEERVDLRAALAALREKHDVATVRVDSGGRLAGALFREGLVDKVSLLMHPAVAGQAGTMLFYPPSETELEGPALSLRLTHMERMRDDILWIIYEVIKPGGKA